MNVQYTEGGVTKYDTFILVVNPAPATSVTLSANSGSVALEEIFKVSDVTATVQPSAYATQGVTWEVYDSDGLVEDSTYVFDGAQFYATEPADVVFHVKANSNGSVYASFTLTITGDPIVHLLDGELVDVTDGSTSVFADAGVLTYGVTTENFEGTMSYGWSTSDSTKIAIDDDQGDTCDFLVKAAGSARLSCRVQGSTKGDVTVYIDVTVSAVTVTFVTWTAPTINVYSGATLSTAGWNVRYSTNSGQTDQTPDSFDILLGGSVVSSGYAFAADDDGKTLAVRVGGTTSATTTTVSVTQSLQAVNMPDEGDSYYQLVSSASDLEAGRYLIVSQDDNIAFDGSRATLDGGQNGFSVTISNGVIDDDSTVSGKYFDLTVENDAWTITSASGGNVAHSATGNGMNGTGTNSISISSGTATITGSGGKILAYNSTSGTTNERFRYYTSATGNNHAVSLFKLVVEEGEGSTNIANVAGHEAAQKAVVKFAKAFNAAMDTTSGCTTNMSSAWSTASGAWTTFTTEASALGSTEEAYAKNLVKYATAQWTSGTDSDYSYCLERAMATYEKCVTAYEMTAFMSAVRPVAAASKVIPLSFVSGNGNTVAIIVIISMVSVTAIGGYFFIRKRKEQ